ncbi:uncharacterized protein A4U43_C03F14780 [Asparagus officinalis]|uniref:Phytocyanin domain-containing protein n=1 Tax=Asparagus officinalis TaxID=4686 RepID=A0A5P1FCY2_ASPOF|nr:uncharacterized protein A4U43_C03F14780 [Asparagus officinalis]
MASSSSLAFACLFMVLAFSFMGLGSATVYKVGDAVGWTVGKIDYGTWLSTLHQKFNRIDPKVALGFFTLEDASVLLQQLIPQRRRSRFQVRLRRMPSQAGHHLHHAAYDSIVLKPPRPLLPLAAVARPLPKIKVTALPSKSPSSAAPSPSPSQSPATSSAPAAAPTSSASAGTTSPSEAPSSAGSSASAGPASAPNSNNAAVVCKGLGLVLSVIVWSMVM